MAARCANNKGVALVTAVLVVTVLLVLSAALVSISLNQNKVTDIFNRRAKAFYIAESGLDHGMYWLRSQGTPPTGNRTDPWGGPQALGDGTYSVTITDLGLVGGAGSLTRRYRITSTGTYQNMNRVLANYVQMDNYARYLWFTDRETWNGVTVWFWTQDHLNGPTHTNGNFNIMGAPQFDDIAQSVADYIRFFNNGHNINLQTTSNPPYDKPVFAQGMTFGVEPTTMPSQALNLRAASTSGGLSLSGNTTVVLNSDGSMNVTNWAKGWNNRNMALPANGALFVNSGQLTISGTLNGQLTVGASRDIVIPTNLTYATNPLVDPSSTDVLGIISERDIVIDHDAPSNLEIDGVIMALDTAFYREDYASGLKGTLTVLGGIIQDERGPVGTFNGVTGQKISGYSKNYLYDFRLQTAPPPFIPTTGDYLTLSWEED